MLEGIIVTVVATLACAAIMKIFDDKSRDKVAYKSHLIKDCLFHSQKEINKILINERTVPFIEDEFIDYSIVQKNGYYPGERRLFNLKIKDKIESVELPYKEIVDFVHKPSTIKLETADFEDKFQLSEALRKKTQPAFEAFKASRMLKTNDSTVRVRDFSCVTTPEDGQCRYVCSLQRASYYDQVHTNLTLDRLFTGIEEDSVRSLDLGPNNSLIDFSRSIMANTLGVSAIWVMEDGDASSRTKKLKYFLMPRSRKTGVYSGMLSSVGGVVQAPESAQFPTDSFEDYAAAEMRREFVEESGVDYLVKKGKLSDTDISIIPLAFVRDLVRGGKPQFFFLIATPHISDKDLAQAFRHSFNGLEEFNRGTICRIKKMNLSPETMCNLLYAMEWIQRKKKIDFIDLD